VWFDHSSSGLLAKGGVLQGFEIAGDDGRFVAASAQIDGKTRHSQQRTGFAAELCPIRVG